MVDAIGWISFYGLTPSLDFFRQTSIDPAKDEAELNVLLSECADLRHVLKSLSDHLSSKQKPRDHKLNIYIHEKNLECIARDLLFLTLICETSYSRRERMELFMDLYANTMLREKTNAYL
jgi:hypothetical protein